MGGSRVSSSAFLLAMAVAMGNPSAAGHPAGCRDLIDSDFRIDTLATGSTPAVGLKEPIHMDFDATPAGTDVYFTERGGRLRRYAAATKTVSTLGMLQVEAAGESGLIGIALDPGFRGNRQLYLFYSPSGPMTRYFMSHRVSRFTLAGDTLVPGSEKILFTVSGTGNEYTGGAMAFDAEGDLWIAVGAGNVISSGQPVSRFPYLAADTHSPLGKLLRIHPEPGGGYSIPAGNLFPDADTSKALREIFAMGAFNPYALTIDPKTGMAAWSDFGKDGGGIVDELNLTGKPGNFGWPYFNGNNLPVAAGQDAARPKADFPSPGLIDLPPAVPATVPLRQSCPIAGPVFRQNAYPDVPGRLPAHFDGLWFSTDFNTGRIDTIDADALIAATAGGAASAAPVSGRAFASFKMQHPTDLRIGPDGALYAVDYAGFWAPSPTSALLRIAYIGDCHAVVTGFAPSRPGPEPFGLSGRSLRVTCKGRYRVSLADAAGRSVFHAEADAPGLYDLGAMSRGMKGIGMLAVRTESGVYVRKVLAGATP
jgi:glucose/arabinose dehydrogenase